MGVPTADQFRAWVAAAESEVFNIALHDAGCTDRPLNRTNAIRVAVAFRTRLDEAWRSAWELPAGQWLLAQREFDRAWKKIHAGRGSKAKNAPVAAEELNYEQWAEKYVTAIEASTFRSGSDDTLAEPVYARAFTRRVETKLRSAFRRNWTVDCVKALAEYFSGTAAEQIITASKQLPIAASKAEKALRQYLEHAEVILAHDVPLLRPAGNYDLERLREFARSLPIRVEQPVRRADERRNERLFVYRMWRANMRAVRGPRTEVISQLMGLEGFQHQYDSRTIEKQCKDFSGTNKRLSVDRGPG